MMRVRRWRRKLIVQSRSIRIRLKSFRRFFTLFSSLVLTGGLLIYVRLDLSFLESVYESLALLFFSTALDYPRGDIILQFMWLVYPLTGLGVIGGGLASLGEAFRLSDPTSEEYNEEMVKIMKNHVIIVGIGNLGLKLLKQLIALEEDIVVIDIKENSSRDDELEDHQIAQQVTIIHEDATRESALLKAGIADARAIFIVIDNDLLNIKIAMMAKDLNPRIKTIVRIYDVEFGKEIGSKLNFDHTLSTSTIAIPSFIDALDS